MSRAERVTIHRAVGGARERPAAASAPSPGYTARRAWPPRRRGCTLSARRRNCHRLRAPESRTQRPVLTDDASAGATQPGHQGAWRAPNQAATVSRMTPADRRGNQNHRRCAPLHPRVTSPCAVGPAARITTGQSKKENPVSPVRITPAAHLRRPDTPVYIARILPRPPTSAAA